MKPAPRSTMSRWQLGGELRRLREAAKIKIDAVAKELGCSLTRVSRIETGHKGAVAKPDEVRTMCRMYGVTDERQIQLLLDMLSNAQQRGWWDSYADVLPSGLDTYFALESGARTERAWEPLLVHGLLQTREYARAVYSAWGAHRPSDIDALVDVRAERQAGLTREADPLEFWLVLDEAAIRRPIGGAEVMKAQLRHLIDMAERPNITVQLLPFNKGGHPGLGGSFSLLEFEVDPTVVYVESLGGNLYLEKRNDVRQFVGWIDLLRATALAPDDTTALLARAAEEM